jgi:DNA-binding beta-propeller fold protein YncE
MKKLLFVLMSFMMVFAFGSMAQNKTVTIPTGNSYIDVAHTAADTVSATRTSYFLLIKAPQHFKTTQDLYVKLDSISLSKGTVLLQGQKFDNGAWVNIGSAVTWNGTSADTSIVISNATATRYRNYKVLFTRTAGKWLIFDSQLKLYFE